MPEAFADGSARGPRVGTEVDLFVVPCRLYLAAVPAARIIGKGGTRIRGIREQSGADVRILEKELPREMQRRDDRIVIISGEMPAIREALFAVLERVFDRSGLPEQAAVAGSRQIDRAHVVEVVVPDKSSAHLIGARGERIKELMEETRCDFHVVKEPMPGLVDQKRVRITGNSAEEAMRAVWRLQEVLHELAVGSVLRKEDFELREAYSAIAGAPGAARGKEIPVRVLIAKEDAAWVVGKRGSKIMKLRDLARVQMNDADAPPFDPADRILEISGAPLEHRTRVVQMLLDDLALRHDEPIADLRLLVPTEQFGSVMGHRGETIRGIMTQTGAKLQQHKADRLEDGSEYRLRMVEVDGDIRQCVEVVRLVHSAMENRNGPMENRNGQHPAVPTPLSVAGPSTSAVVAGVRSREVIRNSPSPAPRTAALTETVSASVTPARSQATSPSSRTARAGDGSRHPTRSVASALGRSADEEFISGRVALQLAMPSDEVARALANDDSGIAWRAGVRLSAGIGAGGVPILQVVGSAVGNSVACYLVQDRLFMFH